jgi:uncharacterized membrane protein YdjX (TVP38/TMEM64 family)
LQSIEPVRFWQFIVATLFISPKLLLHVFIGSKMAALSDGDQRGRMDTRKLHFTARSVVCEADLNLNDGRVP